MEFMCVSSIIQSCPALQLYELQLARLLCPQNFPVKNTGVTCHLFPQGIFPTQGSNPSLSPALQADSLPMEPPGKPHEKHVNVQNKEMTLEIWCISILVCKRMIYYDSLQFLPIKNRRFSKLCQENFLKTRVIIKIMLIIHFQLAI